MLVNQFNLVLLFTIIFENLRNKIVGVSEEAFGLDFLYFKIGQRPYIKLYINYPDFLKSRHLKMIKLSLFGFASLY